MLNHAFSVTYTPDAGLVLSWIPETGLPLAGVPVRVLLKGENTFYVWNVVNSGEDAPGWAEPDLLLTYFGSAAQSPAIRHDIAEISGPDGEAGFRVTGVGERAVATLEFLLKDGELSTSLSIDNPQPLGGRWLPLCLTELRFGEIALGDGAVYLSAHPYGGGTFGYGEIAALPESGVSFAHGCIGLALPLWYLHHPDSARGLQWEFMLDGRPNASLRPGLTPAQACWTLSWTTHRLLAPGQRHSYGGRLRITPYQGRPLEHMRAWRDAAKERYGLTSQQTPRWASEGNMIEFNMNPENAEHPFTRLDDPRCKALLERWKAMGYTMIFGVSSNNVGINWLSPLDYRPCDAVGGVEGERQMLAWAHELGIRVFLWVTTVGIDRNAPEVREHPEWFTHRRNGDLFYCWDSKAPDFVGYAPDADPCSSGWRQWLKQQTSELIERGYDGIFIDGCIPRADNHLRWNWPGEGRNGVEDQVCELAAYVRTLGPELLTFVEDEGLAIQGSCEMTMGRYTAVAPNLPGGTFDPGMQGGPEQHGTPTRIPPEMARHYLLVRYASLLPGAVSNDVLEGYFSEHARPWTAQSLLAGMVPKTHSHYISDSGAFVSIGGTADPSPAEQAPAHRLRGTEEFLSLLRFCRDEPLIRHAPLSIEGVVVEGDAAVVGLLRPAGERSLLVVLQFADRPAQVSVRLAAPGDVPAIDREQAGHPEQRRWTAREILRSMVEEQAAPAGTISGEVALHVALGPCSFRVFELV